jgi:hypothetical protein
VCGWEDDALIRYANDEILARSASWTWWAPEVAAISDRPESLHRDEQGRLHSTTEAALKYRDGWAIHAVHGVRVPADIIEDRASITVARIEGESNAEVRRVMIDLYGSKRYLADSGATVVQECPANHYLIGLRTARLLRKEVAGDEPILIIDLLNSTAEPDGTTKRYQLRVDPAAYDGEASRDCLAAVASTWRLPDGSLAFKRPQDYAPVFESSRFLQRRHRRHDMRLSYLSLQPYASYEKGYVDGRTTYKLSVKYDTDNGAIESRLGPDVATRILAIIADELVKESRQVAEKLTSEILTQGALPAPADVDAVIQ